MSGTVTSAETKDRSLPVLPPEETHSVHIYPGQFCSGRTQVDLSVLVIMKNGDVYGKGHNSVVGWEGRSKFPMKVDGDDILTDFTRIEQLSGLSLKKIVVGLGFGSGLSNAGELYVWGTGRKMSVLHRERVLLRSYDPNANRCYTCNWSIHSGTPWNTHRTVGGFELFYCDIHGYKEYETDAVPSGISVKGFALFGSVPFCHQCGEPCSPKFLITLPYELCFCDPCNLLQEVQLDFSHEPWLAPRKAYSGVLDVDCGFGFLCMLSALKEIKIISWEHGSAFEISVDVQKNQTILAIACGFNHIAAITEPGKLYAFGDCENERIINDRRSVTLRKVNTTGSVVKVCCGDKTTACLMADLSVVLVHNGVPVSRLLNEHSDIIKGIQFTDDFIMSTNGSILSSSSTYGPNELTPMLAGFLGGESKVQQILSGPNLI